MVAVIQQPNYFPWLGYLEQCARADIFVVLDSVQWIRQGRQHRTRVLPPTGQSSTSGFQWLTLPVKGHGHRQRPLRELELDPEDDWSARHWNTIQSVYGRRPRFKDQLEPAIRLWFERAKKFKLMSEAALSSVQLCMDLLEFKPEVAFSSELPETGAKTERLISICRAVHADTYYSALGSTRYVEVGAFRGADIRLIWQHWKHPDYDQGREKFKSHLSFLDALANVPLDEIKAWLAPQPFGPFAQP